MLEHLSSKAAECERKAVEARDPTPPTPLKALRRDGVCKS
jgi:hypothetical protein